MQLLPLDYALLVERPLDEASEMQPSELTHLHVKVERITDNAIRDLGSQLGYIQRSLFERGEDYVRDIVTLIRQNRLSRLDRATLADPVRLAGRDDGQDGGQDDGREDG